MELQLETERLRLLPASGDHLLTLINDPNQFERRFGLHVADGLRDFFISDDVSPEWLSSLRSMPDTNPWRYGFFVMEPESGLIIGSAGFKGEADADGMVEIAYGIVSSYEGLGYATEAASALIEFAFAQGVQIVRAHTLPNTNASTRVLQKCGFHHLGTISDPEDGPVWRWELRPRRVSGDG